MAWIIDFDVHGDRSKPAPCNDNANGIIGPSDYAGDGSDLTHQFRMGDADGDWVYYGRCSSCDDDDAFGPLDDFGEPNYGCCEIQYWNGESWETL